ncbi:MAG TPA: gliding motility-associated C-terminal domain-containing protein, partial [Puia sp.]
VVLKMNNNAPGGNGNDVAIDDITFRTAGSSVTLSSPGYAGDSIQVCDYGQSGIVFNAAVESCYPSQQLQWQESVNGGSSWQDIGGAVATSLARNTTAAGRFEYRLLVAQAGNIGISSCEVASSPMVVDVVRLPAPAVTISASLATICLGLPVTFTAAPVDGGNSPDYQWMVNGQPAGTDSSGFTTSLLVNGDAVQCVMQSDAVCVLQPVASSNVLAEPAVPVPVTGVSFAASATAVCKDSLVQFAAKPENGGDAPSFQWTVNGVLAGGNSSLFTTSLLNDGDVVNCVMTGSLTCSQPVSASPAVKMTVYPLPTIALDSVVVIASGASVRLEPVVTGDIRRTVWTPGLGLDDSLVLTPLATPRVTTAYRLYVETVNGCHVSATERVEVYYPLQMPAAFSPNGDGRNDVFRVPPATPVKIRSLAVFNREGLRVYYTEDVGAGWDGRFDGVLQPAGTYVWELAFISPLTNRVEERKGTVILVR